MRMNRQINVVVWMLTMFCARAECEEQNVVAALWAPNPLVAVYEGGDATGSDDPNCELKLAGTRGGGFSGQVVARLNASGKGPDAKISDVVLKGGKVRIPPSAVEVRYALPTGVNGRGGLPKGKTVFDARDAMPREQDTIHPVWVTVNVPVDAEPGDYEAKLTVGSRSVPVKLSVAAWTLPKPQDYITWVDFIESPESVALRYETPLWSDKHFELMATVFKQLGKVGNKTLYLPLAAKSNLGYENTIVRWIKTNKVCKGQTSPSFWQQLVAGRRVPGRRTWKAGNPADRLRRENASEGLEV